MTLPGKESYLEGYVGVALQLMRVSFMPRKTVDTLQCAEHGGHPGDTYPPSRLVTEAQLREWLTRSRRIYVSWNIETGLRQERLASNSLDPTKVRIYAATLWLRYCSEYPLTDDALELQTEQSRGRVIQSLRAGLNHLRDAFRAPYGIVPAEVEPGTQLAVALFGCAPASVAPRASATSPAALPL